MAKKEQSQEKATGKIECAVRFDCHLGKHDDIVSLDSAEAEAARAAGYVDTHPNAIKAIREG
jgi:hypothetical protein